MSRLIVLVLILSLGNTSLALAGETLLGVATRLAREASPGQESAEPKAATATAARKDLAIRGVAAMMAPGQLRSATLAQEPAVSASGMRKRTKVLIYLAAGLGVVGSWYAIDHRVEDNTPSTLGTRQD